MCTMCLSSLVCELPEGRDVLFTESVNHQNTNMSAERGDRED
jgi:hypothetical protein